MSSSLIKVQIGPVREFIAQARSTRDLWSGSYLLSWLMATGARALVEAAGEGNDPSVVISPVLSGQPIFEFNPNSAEKNLRFSVDEILTPNFTNILLAKVPQERARPAVDALVGAIEEERKKIGRACWQKLLTAGFVQNIDFNRFEEQLKSFPSIAWQITRSTLYDRRDSWLAPVPMDDEVRRVRSGGADPFPAQVTYNGWALDAVRSLRRFEGRESARHGIEKDSLNGSDDSILGGPEWWDRHIAPLSSEGPQGGRASIDTPRPGTEGVTKRWPILFRKRQRGDHLGAIQIVKRIWHWAYLEEVVHLDAGHRREPKGKQFPFPSTAHVAIHDPAKNLDENSDELADTMRAEFDADHHDRYFAVLAVDGDQMGLWLNGENSDGGPTEQFRRDLSERLSHFALRCVRPIVEACDGRLILAGGEDVLAILPADTVLDCARFLRQAYRGEPGFIEPMAKLAGVLCAHHRNHGLEEPTSETARHRTISPFLVAAARGTLFQPGKSPGSLGFNPSVAAAGSETHASHHRELKLPGGVPRREGVALPDLSAGIAIAHVKEPLQDVVEAASNAEDRAKKKLGRSALAVTLVKHSGETIEWGCKWDSKGIELLDLIQSARGRGIFSNRFPHRLVEALSRYRWQSPDLDANPIREIPAFEAALSGIALQELSVTIARQKGTAAPEVRKAFLTNQFTNPLHRAREYLTYLEQSGRGGDARLEEIIGLCQVAAFIRPTVHSPSFALPAETVTKSR